MPFFKFREDPAPSGARLQARWAVGGAGDDRSPWPLTFAFLAVSLLHAALIARYLTAAEPETPAVPLVMDVQLVAPPAAQAPAPTPPQPAPPKPQPKPQPKPAPKKPPVPKKPKAEPRKVAAPAPQTEPEPAPKVETTAPAASPAPTQPPRPVAPVPPKAESFTEANYRANYKSNPKPEYPRLAKSRGWQGKVLLRVEVTADGRSARVTVQQSSGHDMLDEAAVEAVENWTFIPAKRGATAVASTVTVPIQFKLSE